MFGERKQNPATPRAATSVEGLVGPRMRLTGDVSFAGALHIDGFVNGNVQGEQGDSLLVLTERGTVEGTVRAPHVEIAGSMLGDVYSGERLKLFSSAKVRGNVYYKVLEMEAGAEINGQMICGDAAQKNLPQLSRDADDDNP